MVRSVYLMLRIIKHYSLLMDLFVSRRDRICTDSVPIKINLQVRGSKEIMNIWDSARFRSKNYMSVLLTLAAQAYRG